MRSDLRIDPSAVRELLDSETSVQVLDVRGSAAHRRANERVQADIRVMARAVATIADRLDPDTWILAYCTWKNDGLAARAAARLRDLGFERAHAVEGGLEGCRRARLAVVEKRWSVGNRKSPVVSW